MTDSSLIDSLTELALPLAASLGLRLWGIELGAAGRRIVRIYIERAETHCPDAAKEQGLLASRPEAESLAEQDPVLGDQRVGIDDCAHFSRLFGLSLEVEDLIAGAYVLEVSSPGLERKFFTPAQLASALDMDLELTLLDAPRDASLPAERRKFRGRLVAAPQADASGLVDPGALFTLRLPEPGSGACPGQLLHFAWKDLKKAQQIYLPPEKSLPGKGRAKKKQPWTEAGPGTHGVHGPD
ncbi:ribosome maturation factor RimP [Desulfovibrio sp. OttesenSCG-928-A18]|nr:ribosome maturation factor RimP [Desulfovibrio sp. OttesenSCG-928-A18]